MATRASEQHLAGSTLTALASLAVLAGYDNDLNRLRRAPGSLFEAVPPGGVCTYR